MILLMFRFLNRINQILDIWVRDLYPSAWVYLFVTLCVLYLPLHFIFDDTLFRNVPFASLFSKSYPIINNQLLFLHIFAATFSIIVGPFLFSPKLRKNYPKWHIRMGQIYAIGCLVSAITVLPLAWSNAPGSPGRYGFTPMAIFWFLTTYFAYTAAIHKNYITHRRWMMRSYAMTLAFIHVNLTYKFFLPFDAMSFNAIKVMQSMVSWMGNLFIIEFYIAATAPNGRFLGFSQWGKNLLSIAPQDKYYWRFWKIKPNHSEPPQSP
ncbi:MAG: DUF2306 domain-containing protein [Alphaproteobacteria bacterium]|nr:DUF2306 domain-containing protein [Alphaproteobacteria bacterium]